MVKEKQKEFDYYTDLHRRVQNSIASAPRAVLLEQHLLGDKELAAVVPGVLEKMANMVLPSLKSGAITDKETLDAILRNCKEVIANHELVKATSIQRYRSCKRGEYCASLPAFSRDLCDYMSDAPSAE